MPQHSHEDAFTPVAGTYSGPRLTDVLEMVGGTSDEIILYGVDGFQASLTSEEIEEFDPVLAIYEGGTPLELGSVGPVRLVFPTTGDDTVDDTNFNYKAVWGLYHIMAE